MAELLAPKLKDRSGATLKETPVAGSYRASPPTLAHVQQFEATSIASGESLFSDASQPDVSTWTLQGTDNYDVAEFFGTGASSAYKIQWDYLTGSGGNLDKVYIRAGTDGLWTFAGQRYNDQSHVVTLNLTAYGAALPLAFGLQHSQDDAVTTKFIYAYKHIDTISLQSSGTNASMQWTVSGAEPPGLAGYYIFAAADLPESYAIVASFVGTLSGTFAAPVGGSGNFYAYVAGHNGAGEVITLHPSVETATTL